MDEIKWKVSIGIAEISSWKYCPRCGSELIEVYPGDFRGHTSCMNEEDEYCSVEFDVLHIVGGEAWCGGRKYGST